MLLIKMLTISNFFRLSVLSFFIHNYLKTKYPDEYHVFFINTSYNIIYYYSKIQLLCNKLKIIINKVIESNDHLKKLSNNFYNKNNNFVDVVQFNNIGNIYKKRYENDNLNLDISKNILYIFLDYKNECTNYIISRSLNFNYGCQTSNIKFIMVELDLGDKKFKIDLKTDTENYYIVSNVFDKDFFLYYMFDHSHNYEEKIIYEDLLKLIENAKVTIIDHNVNKLDVEFAKNGRIQLLKDDYVVNHDITN